MSNTTPFPKESLQTVSGKVTAWLPLTTPWPSSSDCNTHVYAQNGDGTLIGWDPYFDLYVEPSSIHCLPPEVTSSWWQSNSDTVTLLGPSFACPSAYSAVQTNLIASSTQHILCCPSNYQLLSQITGQTAFPSQCTSTLVPSSLLVADYSTSGGNWYKATSTIMQVPPDFTGIDVVYGMHVNGYNIVTASQTGTASPASRTSSPSNTSSPEPKSSSTSSAAAIGLGVGLGGAAIIAAIAAWFFYRRWRDRTQAQKYIPAPASSFNDEVTSYNTYNMSGLHEAPVTIAPHEAPTDGIHQVGSGPYEVP